MHVFLRCAGAVVIGLGVSSTALAQHGRPPMVYEVVSVSAKEMQIFPDGDEAEARDINNLGELVGWAATALSDRHAFKRTLLGSTIDVGSANPWDETVAEGINDNSEVVGYWNQFGHDRPFYWAAIAGFVPLNREYPEGYDARGRANAINVNGRIVGTLGLSTSNHAVTWWHRSAAPSLVFAPPPGVGSSGQDVSDSAWFAGFEYGPTRGFRYRLGTLEYLPDPSPVSDGTAHSVNEAGTVVGSTWYPLYGYRAIRYRRTGSPLILGLLPGGTNSEARDINETEFVVGHSDMQVLPGSEERRERAFLFHIEFGMVALPIPSGFRSPLQTDCVANALNDRKESGLIQVAGYCTRNGKKQAVRWDVFVGEHP